MSAEQKSEAIAVAIENVIDAWLQENCFGGIHPEQMKSARKNLRDALAELVKGDS